MILDSLVLYVLGIGEENVAISVLNSPGGALELGGWTTRNPGPDPTARKYPALVLIIQGSRYHH